MAQAATSVPQHPPLSRLVRLGLGLGLKPHPPSHAIPHRDHCTDDSDWYIPYNGPYEKPKETKQSPRDSWEYDPFGAPRNAGIVDDHPPQGITRELAPQPQPDPDERRGRTRSRAISAASRDTGSLSGASAVIGDRRRSELKGAPSPRMRQGLRSGGTPSFLNLDTSGTGIGESPVPAQRAFGAPPHSPVSSGMENAAGGSGAVAGASAGHRGSFASFWTFGQGSNRKSPTSTHHSIEGRSRPSTSTQYTSHTTNTRRERAVTLVPDDEREKDKDGLEPMQFRARPRAITTLPPASSFRTHPASDAHRQQPNGTPNVPTVSASNPTNGRSTYQQPHPYAVALPSLGHRNRSALLRVPMSNPNPVARLGDHRSPAVTLTSPPPGLLKKRPSRLMHFSTGLKTSVSTPDLRAAHKQQGKALAGSQPTTPNFGSKWLSAETWCDALIFPRPRFRVRAAHPISPPDSPVSSALSESTRPSPILTSPLKEKQGDVGRSPQEGVIARRKTPTPQGATTHAVPLGGSVQKPTRPRSFAQDDLSLPSPMPSLARVLKEGEMMQKERRDWNKQATRSFANKRSRSLSRSRVSALTRKGTQHTLQGGDSDSDLAQSFDLLASTAFHGHQLRKPSISAPRSSTSNSGFGTASTGTGSGVGFGTSSTGHSRKSSGASHPRGHHRKDSWGKTALKAAKSNAAGICTFGADDHVSSPVDEKALGLEDAISREGTKLLTLGGRGSVRDTRPQEAGVVLIESHSTQPLLSGSNGARMTGLSPTPSARSASSEGVAMGIAVSTPTAFAPLGDIGLEAAGRTLAADYAGPHPSSPKVALSPFGDGPLNDVSTRHRLPPRPTVSSSNSPYPNAMSHPYAAEFRPQPSLLRVPAPVSSRMFAQVQSGTVREVTAEEFQYSPLPASSPAGSHRNSALGVEEALNLAFRRESVHTAFESSEGHGTARDEEHGLQAAATMSQLQAGAWPQAPLDARPPPITNAQLSGPSVIPMASLSSNDLRRTPLVVSPTPPNRVSPGVTSLESSPELSPRVYGISDDLDDLFYKPGQRSADPSLCRTPSSELMRSIGSRHGSGNAFLNRLPSIGSSSLHLDHSRDISEDTPPENDAESRMSGAELASISSWVRLHGDMGTDRFSSEMPDPHFLVPPGSLSPPRTLPLRLPDSRARSLQTSLLIPEDVMTSRASSLLERDDRPEEADIYYCLRQVPSLATPEPVDAGHRTSTRVEYIDDEDLQPQAANPEASGQLLSVQASLAPPFSVSDMTRVSYFTTTSGDSRISQLSDFPVPPVQDAMTTSTMLQPHYHSTPQDQIDSPIDPSVPQYDDVNNRSSRTTLGGNDDLPGPGSPDAS